MDVDTEALRWFQQVADGVTVTEVAQTEHITQPGLSRALARLEREVGTALLRRHGRVLRPTEAGRAFKRHVDRVLHELDVGVAAVEQLLDPETGSVGVAFERSMGTWLVPQLVSGFHADHPRVRVVLHHGGGHGEGVTAAGGPVDVELTSRRYARVMPYLNTDFRVTARILPIGAEGIVRWSGARNDRLSMEFVARTEPVRRGQAVVTAGRGDVFPEGFLIGYVESVNARAGRNALDVELRPAAPLARATHAFVLLALPDSERVRLEAAPLQ